VKVLLEEILGDPVILYAVAEPANEVINDKPSDLVITIQVSPVAKFTLL
jgi:hypothetical protein